MQRQKWPKIENILNRGNYWTQFAVSLMPHTFYMEEGSFCPLIVRLRLWLCPAATRAFNEPLQSFTVPGESQWVTFKQPFSSLAQCLNNRFLIVKVPLSHSAFSWHCETSRRLVDSSGGHMSSNILPMLGPAGAAELFPCHWNLNKTQLNSPLPAPHTALPLLRLCLLQM